MWAEGHETLRSSTRVRGRRVTCVATPEQWRFEPGDGARYVRAGPGAAPPRHAVEHVYERKGWYTQRLVVRWRLSTNYGSRSVDRATTRSYQVVEVRGALVSG